MCQTTGKAARLFKDSAYQTENSWSRPRRVVGKAEHLPDGANPRFVVTSLAREKIDARSLYEDLYCARGEMENRIKEQQLDLFADRTSSATMPAMRNRSIAGSVCTTSAGSRHSRMQPASVSARPSRRSASRNRARPPSDEISPPSKPAVTFLCLTAGRSNGSRLSLVMVGVALSLLPQKLASTTNFYTITTTYATFATTSSGPH